MDLSSLSRALPSSLPVAQLQHAVAESVGQALSGMGLGELAGALGLDAHAPAALGQQARLGIADVGQVSLGGEEGFGLSPELLGQLERAITEAVHEAVASVLGGVGEDRARPAGVGHQAATDEVAAAVPIDQPFARAIDEPYAVAVEGGRAAASGERTIYGIPESELRRAQHPEEPASGERMIYGIPESKLAELRRNATPTDDGPTAAELEFLNSNEHLTHNLNGEPL